MVVSFEEYKRKEKETEDYKKSICKVIDDYIKYNNLITSYNYCYDFYFDNHDRFMIKYNDGHQIFHPEYYLRNYVDLLEFMKDPELYKNTKKYNL